MSNFGNTFVPSGVSSTPAPSTTVINGPAGFGDNYVITPSVVSSDLIVAIKTMTGGNPSSSDSVPIRIRNTRRVLQSALSVTVDNATGSVFNAGSSELKTWPIGLFVYLGWRVSDSSIFILISRVSYGKTYADFSITATNELYGAYSGAAPASTDELENVGYFEAQNDGSASFIWSIPAPYTINAPTFDTRVLSWTASLVGFGTPPSGNVYRYKIIKNIVFIWVNQGSGGISNSTAFSISLPIRPTSTFTNGTWEAGCVADDNGSTLTNPARASLGNGGVNLNVYPNQSTTLWTAANGKRLRSLEMSYFMK